MEDATQSTKESEKSVKVSKPVSKVSKTVKKTPMQKRMQALQKQMQLHVSKQPTTVEEWLKAKVLFPSKFQVSQQGDLLSPPINEGEREIVIGIKPDVPATIEYTQDFFQKRRDALKEPEELTTTAKRALHTVMNDYRKGLVPVSDVLDANRKTQDAECRLNNLAKLPFSINNLTGVLKERDLTLQHYDDRTIAEPVFQAMYTTVPWNAFWMTATDAASTRDEAELTSAPAPVEGKKKPKLTRRLTAQQVAIINANRAKARF
jgi:hypothetical protein